MNRQMEKYMPEEEKHLEPALFEQKQIRRMWHKGEWFYSIIDVIAILTDSPQPRIYWAQLKERVKTEGFDEVFAHIEQLKLKSPDRYRKPPNLTPHYSVNSLTTC